MNNKFGKIIIILMYVFLVSGCQKEELKNPPQEDIPKEKELVCKEGKLENNQCKIVTIKEGTLTCKEGYTLDNDSCQKVILIDAVKKSSCPEGFELKYDGCISIKDYSLEKNENNEDICPGSTTKRGSVCKEILKENNEYSCIKGTLKDTSCEIIDKQDAGVMCPEGFKLNQKVCEKIEYKEPEIIEK